MACSHTTAQLQGWVSPAFPLPQGLVPAPALVLVSTPRPGTGSAAPTPSTRPTASSSVLPSSLDLSSGPVMLVLWRPAEGGGRRAGAWSPPGATPSGPYCGHRADGGEERRQGSRGRDSGSQMRNERGLQARRLRLRAGTRGREEASAGSRGPVPGEDPLPELRSHCPELKPESRSPRVPGPESAPGVAAPSRPPRPALPCVLCRRLVV